MLEVIGYIISTLFLIVLSILDIKTYNLKNGFIPSALTTSFIIIAFILGGFNIGVNVLLSGVLVGLLAWLFIDLEMFYGLPDLKVMIATGMTFITMFDVLYFGLFIAIIGLVVKFFISRYSKNKAVNMPFIPVILCAYIGGVALALY